MRSAVFVQFLVLVAMLLLFGTKAVPVAEFKPDLDSTVSGLVERRTHAPSTAQNAAIRKLILDMHNKERWWHHAPPLKWDPKLASYAQEYANTCASNHSLGPYGENLFGMPHANRVDDWYKQTKEAVLMWIREVGKFPWHDPQFTKDTGHFAQIIWKSSETLGCAWNTVICDDGWVHLFCEFDPPGNVIGWYKDNTLPH